MSSTAGFERFVDESGRSHELILIVTFPSSNDDVDEDGPLPLRTLLLLSLGCNDNVTLSQVLLPLPGLMPLPPSFSSSSLLSSRSLRPMQDAVCMPADVGVVAIPFPVVDAAIAAVIELFGDINGPGGAMPHLTRRRCSMNGTWRAPSPDSAACGKLNPCRGLVHGDGDIIGNGLDVNPRDDIGELAVADTWGICEN
jgi:hypothetical protein